MASSNTIIFLKIVTIAWRNVRRNWRHSLATITAIALGFMAISLFDGFIRELRDRTVDGYAIRGMMGDVIVQKAGAQEFSDEDPWKYALGREEQSFLEDFLKADPAVLRRVRFLSASGLATADANNAIFWGVGFDLKEGAEVRGDRWQWDTTAGKPLHLNPKQSVIVAEGLAELLGCKPTSDENFILRDGHYVPAERPFQCASQRLMISATTENAQVNAIQVNIAGLFDAGFRDANNRSLRLSLEDAQLLLDTDKITMVSVQLKNSSLSEGFIKRLHEAAKRKDLQLEVTPWIDHRIVDFVKGGFSILEVFGYLFMAVVTTIVVMSIANTMMKAVNERIREIGTLRSMGYLRQQLMLMFAFEGFFISLIATSIGLIFTLALSQVIGFLGITYKAGVLSIPIPLVIAPAPSAWLLSFITLSILAIFTAWFCSRKACRMTIAHAMRHV